MTSWFSICSLKQRFLQPVSKFWDLQTFQRFKFFFFKATQPQFSHVCLSSWWVVTAVSLAFAQKQALVLGRPGIRNSPINLVLDIYVTVNWQLCQKRYPLSNIKWLYCGLRYATHWSDVFLKSSTDQFVVFNLSRAQVNLFQFAFILGDRGALNRDYRMFVVKVYCKIEKRL